MPTKREILMAFPLAAGLILGLFVIGWYFNFPIIRLLLEKSSTCSQYSLTDQTLDCSNFDDTAERLKSIDTAIDDATAQYIKEGRATQISVWVRDLTDKQTASNNENLRYAPASLLKVPLMIAYYKLAEIEPAILTTQITYDAALAQNDSIQNFAPSSTLKSGSSYTAEELIDIMIIQSDNGAADALLTHIDQNFFTKTLLDLGIEIPSSNNMDVHDFVTAKSYATIFRTLYNASYLSRDNSQKALELLSKTAFSGIAQPLPKGTVVAHKFGERETSENGTVVRELHDCGIVYKQDRPYSLCIMTQGKDFNDLLGVIKDLSALIYPKI